MKRFTVLAALLSLAAVTGWAFFQTVSAPKASSTTKYDSTPILVHYARAEMEKATNVQDDIILVSGVGAAIVPVYDATGAMLEPITPKEALASPALPPVYNATGAMLVYEPIIRRQSGVIQFSDSNSPDFSPHIDSSEKPEHDTGCISDENAAPRRFSGCVE